VVLFGHENNQLLNCPVDPGSSWASMLRAIEFARDDAECLAAQSTTNRAELARSAPEA
jgi:hypothetical protein